MRDRPAAVQYQVRQARITDVEPIVRLVDRMAAAEAHALPASAPDLLRQLVYLPHAVVLVATMDRQVVGTAVLALRPSIRQAGFVGSVDLVVVDPNFADEGVMDALIEEVLRSAGNKGCAVVEAALPDDSELRARWQEHGFSPAGPRFERPLTPVGAGMT